MDTSSTHLFAASNPGLRVGALYEPEVFHVLIV